MIQLSDLRSSLGVMLRTLAYAGWPLFGIVLFNQEIEYVVRGDLPSPRLEVVELRYERGKFYQIVQPKYSQLLWADWAANIKRKGSVVCTGSGRWPYRPKILPSEMTPDVWTGGDCSGLVIGGKYTANAVWTWRNSEGLEESITRHFDFIHEGPGA